MRRLVGWYIKKNKILCKQKIYSHLHIFRWANAKTCTIFYTMNWPIWRYSCDYWNTQFHGRKWSSAFRWVKIRSLLFGFQNEMAIVMGETNKTSIVFHFPLCVCVFEQVLMCSGRQLSTEISSKFVMYTQHHFQSHYKTSPMKNSNQNLMMSREMCLKQIENGMRLGTFLSELGWLQDSLKVLVSILNVINTLKLNYNSIIVKLDCLQRWVFRFCFLCRFAFAHSWLFVWNREW